MSHSRETACSCEHCQMLDAMYGDPLLNDWGHEFVESVARQGWDHDYTDKQKAKIEELYEQQRSRYVRREPTAA